LKIKVLILISLLCFSFIVLPIINVNAITWDLLVENWNNLDSWSVYGSGIAEINPSGQLRIKPNYGTYKYVQQDIGTLPDNGYTCEYYLKIDSFGNSSGKVYVPFYDGVNYVRMEILSNKISVQNESDIMENYTLSTDNNWYRWRLLINSTEDTLNVYRNGVFINEFTSLKNYTLGDGNIVICAYNPSNGVNCEIHMDYTYIATGLYIPTEKEITFIFNEGGILKVNNMTVSNNSKIEYENNTIIELMAIVEGNYSYGFNNFTWNEQEWNLLNETWDSLGNWNKTGYGISIISPSGQLFQKSDTGLSVGREKDLTDLPSKYTAEFRHKHEKIIDYFIFYNGEHQLEFGISSTGIFISDEYNNIDSFTFTVNNEFHIWRLVMDSTIEKLKVFFDNIFIKEWNSILSSSSYDGRIRIETTDFITGSHQDYIRIITGLYDYTTFSINNPFYFTIFSNNTIWCYFDLIETFSQEYEGIGLIVIVISLCSCLMLIAVYGGKKK